MSELRRSARLALVGVWLPLFLSPSSIAAKEVRLGGPRAPVAQVSKVAGELKCALSFVPVVSFDAATNQLVNQRKGRFYALLALREFEGLGNGDFEAPDLRAVTPMKMEGGRITITYRSSGLRQIEGGVPKIIDLKQIHEVEPDSTGANLRGGLLSALGDYSATLRDLVSLASGKVAGLAAGRDDLENRVAELEAWGLDAFEAYTEEIEESRMLLRSEKAELGVQARASRAQFLADLKAAYERLSNTKTE